MAASRGSDAAAPGPARRTGGGRHRGGGRAAAVFETIASSAMRPAGVRASLGRRPSPVCTWWTARGKPGQIVVPTGALLGLDGVRAAAEGRVDSVTIESREPPGLQGAPYSVQRGIDAPGSMAASGYSRAILSAAAASRRTSNVAAALALAGIGPQRTRVEIWADPTITRDIHTIRVEAEAARMHHDNRECAESRRIRAGPDHGTVDAGLPARPGGDAEGRHLDHLFA